MLQKLVSILCSQVIFKVYFFVSVDLVTFTEKILNGKLHSLCSELYVHDQTHTII